jgi:hypothetical protein
LKRLGLATLLVFDLVLFAPLLWTGGVLSSHDFVRAHHPWRMGPDGVLESENRLLSDPAASGETTLVRYRKFPEGFFWNPWVASGGIGPFHLAQGFLSPFVALPAFLLPEAGIETGILFLKFNFAFLAAYAFFRSRRFSDLAASAGAAAWAFATGQTVWGLWMQTSVSVTYPLLLMAVDRALEETGGLRGDARAIRFGALAILLCLAGGFPHWILYGAGAAALYLLMRVIERRRSGVSRAGGVDAAHAFIRLALCAAIAVAILTPSILATGRFLRESGYGELRRGMGGSFALPLRHLLLYAWPNYLGTPRRDDYSGVGWIPGDNYIETAAGVGVAAAALALVGLATTFRRRNRRGEALFAAILAALIAIPLYGGGAILRVVGRLPLLDIGLFARAKILIVFALAILAACGVEALERLAECEGDALERGAAYSPAGRLALRAVPFVIAIPLALLALDFYPECRPEQAVFRDTPGIVRLREAARRGERFAAAGWTLIPNVSEALGLDDVRGHFLLDAGYRRLLTAADPHAYGSHGTYLVFDPRSLDPHSAVLDLLGVRWLAAPPAASRPVGTEVESRDAAPFLPEESAAQRSEPNEPGGPSLARVYAGSDLSLFERLTAFPRFFSVAETRLGGVEEVRRADRDTLASVVYVSPAEQARLEAVGTRRPASHIAIADLLPERFRVEVEGDAPSLLVSTQKRFPPYWRTSLDGRDVPAFTADGLFLGVDVPAGRHVVEGRFVVPRAEVAISIIGVAALLAVMISAKTPRL